jgi:SAM-dependent methyltransferase
MTSILEESSAKDKREQSAEEIFKLAPFNPSSLQIQEKAIEHLKLSADDVLFDLGCGDGRLLIAAARATKGLRCVGVEMDPIFVKRGLEAVQQLDDDDLKGRIDIRVGDVLELMKPPNERKQVSLPELVEFNSGTDPIVGKECQNIELMENATAIYLFILPKGVNKIMPILEAIVERRKIEGRPFRILSYIFKLHEWEPTFVDRTSKGDLPIYVYEFSGGGGGKA